MRTVRASFAALPASADSAGECSTTVFVVSPTPLTTRRLRDLRRGAIDAGDGVGWLALDWLTLPEFELPSEIVEFCDTVLLDTVLFVDTVLLETRCTTPCTYGSAVTRSHRAAYTDNKPIKVCWHRADAYASDSMGYRSLIEGGLRLCTTVACRTTVYKYGTVFPFVTTPCLSGTPACHDTRLSDALVCRTLCLPDVTVPTGWPAATES